MLLGFKQVFSGNGANIVPTCNCHKGGYPHKNICSLPLWWGIEYSCINTYGQSCLKPLSHEQNPCLDQGVHVLFELDNTLNEPKFAMITLYRKALWPGLIGSPIFLFAKTF